MSQDSIIKDLCQQIRKTALKPAEDESEKLLSDAKLKAEQIISAAQKQADEIIQSANREAKKTNASILDQLKLAHRQSLLHIKNDINRLVVDSITKLVNNSLRDTNTVKDIIKVVLKSLEKHGFDSNYEYELSVDESIDKNKLLQELGATLRLDLTNKVLSNLGRFSLRVTVINDKVTCVFDDQFIQELVYSFIQADLRNVVDGK